MSCGKIKNIQSQSESREQLGAPCPIGMFKKSVRSLNFIETQQTPPQRQSAPKRSPRPKPSRNIIKIRLDGVPKDITIKFADKETLIRALNASVALLASENANEILS